MRPSTLVLTSATLTVGASGFLRPNIRSMMLSECFFSEKKIANNER